MSRTRMVTKAVVIKVPVATIDLPDTRDIPHTPCPLVQTLPDTDPNPTNKPAIPRRM